MPFQLPPRTSSVLPSALAAVGIALAVGGCSHVTPLGPNSAGTPVSTQQQVEAGSPVLILPPRHLGTSIVLQVMRSQPPSAAGGCLAGWRTLAAADSPSACYRPVGKPVTITSASVSSLSRIGPPPPQAGQSAGPVQYGFTVVLSPGDAAAVTALITQAYDSRNALGISAAGKLWQAPQVDQPFSGVQLQIAFLTKNEALQLHRILVPSG